MEINEENHVIEDKEGNTIELYNTENSIYDKPIQFMVSFWVRGSYFNNQQIQIGNIEIMSDSFSFPGYFGSKVGSKCNGHKIYTGKSAKSR